MEAVKPEKTHPAFTWKRSEAIAALNIVVEEYEHIKTGAMHYHMCADNKENVFLVALRTQPKDSTGVAHILEHTALCGSKRYPVRDPFFMMIRRSLNTFMNAFTSNDWTAYPFASQNRKDFDNLLDVYLDAVFFSRLDPLDFAQEGHRLEFAESDNADSQLVRKGVVFNEMKGAMSSVPSTLWQTLCKYLYPNTTYHYNSGGDPEHIPDLDYEELKAFYQTHYHPGNAIFMTFGDIPAYEHHEKFESLALKHFDKPDKQISAEDEKRYHAPIRIEESYAYDEADGLDKKAHLVMGWLLGKSTRLQDTLTAHLVSSVLLDNSASPLQQALETTDLGSAPSPLCGLEDSNRELVFVCGLEGCNTANADAFETLVIETLQEVADKGVPQEQVEAVLHQLELSQREIGGDGYPYGLQLILAAIPSATHRGDPIALLNLEPVLKSLREQIKDPEFIKNQVRKLLIDNQHRVRLTLKPDAQLAARRDAAEAAQLSAIKASLSEAQKQQIILQSKQLKERQLQIDDDSILPKVTLEDVPEDMHIPTGTDSDINALPLSFYAQGTNGIVYQQIIIELPRLSDEQLEHLPYYTHCLTEVGLGEADYLATQTRQSSVCGSISAYSTSRGSIHDEQDVSAYLILSAKALVRKHQETSQLLHDTLHKARFDELPRIREIVAQMRARREQSITGNGHGLAMLAASSGMSPTAALSHRLSGLQGVQSIKALDKSLDQEKNLSAFASHLAEIHALIVQAPRQLLLVGEAERASDLENQLGQSWSGTSKSPSELLPFSLPPVRKQVAQVWETNTQVNFCAKAYPTVAMGHPDCAALTVLGGFLRNGFLHRAIREQGGAYGGGASHDSSIAAFRFYSYRDPRLVETLADFDQSVQWLLTEKHEYQQLEEAILGVISSIDKPGSPAGEAKQAFHNELFGRTAQARKQFRSEILDVTLDDLKRVAKLYLLPEKASIAVITNPSGYQQNLDFFKEHNVERHII
jgi:hypothetical protein